MTTVAIMLPQEELKCKSSTEDSLGSSVVEFISEDTPADNNIFSDGEHQKDSEDQSKTETNLEENAPDSTSNHTKRKNKNRKKKKWKPYAKMTWIERQRREERDARRATRIREEMTASGFPLAPYNTTQFLMEDHNIQDPDYEQIANGHRIRDNSNSSSEDFYSSPEDEEEFLQQQFVQVYEDIHAERLNNMSKTELVEELVNIEDKVEALEKILEEARAENKLAQRTVQPTTSSESDLAKIHVFREEIEKLKKENYALERENDRLRMRLKVNT